jgi:cation:H+ antiporter
VHSQVLRKELPILILLTGLSAALLWDNQVSRGDAWVLLAVFAGLMGWTIRQGIRNKTDVLGTEVGEELSTQTMPLNKALLRLLIGLALLVGSSRLLVWGAVEIAHGLGVSDLVIGLTIIAVGTSLPELASSLAATRKGEHDIALGNVLGSNIFNTLAVVGIAGTIQPMAVGPEVLTRDVLVMALLTLSLFVFCYGFRGPGRINRLEGGILLACYIGYNSYLATTVFGL